MKANQVIRNTLIILIVSLLLITNPNSALAGNSKGNRTQQDDEYVGSVSSGRVYSNPLPAPANSKGGIIPNASNPVPGGGYAWANAILAWSYLRMDGMADTGLTSDVTEVYSLCARATEIFKDSVSKGGESWDCDPFTGGGSIRSKTQVFEIPFNHTWRLDTNHGVSASGYNWWPSITIFANP